MFACDSVSLLFLAASVRFCKRTLSSSSSTFFLNEANEDVPVPGTSSSVSKKLIDGSLLAVELAIKQWAVRPEERAKLAKRDSQLV
jgi:hypothetical protein